MIELLAMGTAQVRHVGDGPSTGPSLPPKRLALLSYLALARPRGFQRRDVLCAMFWPESDHVRARNALSQALHAVRLVLGEEALVSRGREEVGLAEGAVTCDALAFERQLEAGRRVEALDTYRGELLQGLHVRGAEGFERWLDGERSRVRRRARDAASRLAEDAESSGNVLGAARWLERGLEIVPTDEALANRLIGLLHRAGDRTGAFAASDRFVRMLEAEYGIEPSDETLELIALVRRREASPASAGQGHGRTRVRSIAVLPLRDLGTGESRAYTAEGMTEALIMELGRIRALRVVSHQSVRRFEGSRQPLRDIARSLDVDALVEGSLLEAGGRVRVTAQLVRAEPEEHLWSDAFEGDLSDVLSVHRDLARAIGRALAAALSKEEEHQLGVAERVKPAAYHAYLQGWMKHATLLPSELAEAIPLYLQAVSLDPEFAPAHAYLAQMYYPLLSMGELPLEEGRRRLRAAADLALELDPSLAAAHAAQGVACMIEHDWDDAEEALRRAVTMAPSLAIAQASLCTFLTGMRRFAEAVEVAERTRRLDPLAPYANWISGWCLHYARRPDESIRDHLRVLELFPDYALAWIFLAKCHYQMDDREATLHACRRSLELLPDNPMVLGYAAHMLARSGAPERAHQVMERLERQRQTRGSVAPYYAAVALCGLGSREQALARLDEIRPEASTTGWLLAAEPLFDPLRGEPGFEAVLRRIGVPAPPADG